MHGTGGRDGEDEDDVPAEPCDLCRTAILDGDKVYSRVRDSAVNHAHDPRYDGESLVVACA